MENLKICPFPKQRIFQLTNQQHQPKEYIMLNFILSIVSLFTLSLFGAFEWMGEIITAHYIASVIVAILGLLIARASLRLRTVLESVESIISLYAEYSHPESEGGKKLTQDERRRLLELCLKELRTLVNHFSEGLISNAGKLVRRLFQKIGLL